MSFDYVEQQVIRQITEPMTLQVAFIFFLYLALPVAFIFFLCIWRRKKLIRVDFLLVIRMLC